MCSPPLRPEPRGQEQNSNRGFPLAAVGAASSNGGLAQQDELDWGVLDVMSASTSVFTLGGRC